MKKNECLVSLIISIYNGEKYLRECLLSIQNQTYTNFEVLMIDDGSIDNSAEIAKEFSNKDNRFIYFSFSNRGCSAERNFGIEHCKGEYIGIIDQDDLLSQHYIEYFMYLINLNHVDIATSYNVNSFAGSIIRDSKMAFNRYEIVKGSEAAKLMLLNRLIIGPWNKLIKKDLLTNNNIKFFFFFYCGEGLAFSVEAFQATPYVAIGYDAVYNYRIDNSCSGNSNFSVQKLESALLANDYIKNISLDRSKKMFKIIEYSRWRSKLYYFTLLKITNSESSFEDIYCKLKKECKKDAFKGLFLNISLKQKLNCLFFGLFPETANKLFKIRKSKR